MLSFLRSIILLDKFSYTSLKKSVPMFKHDSSQIRGSFLYKQGKPANFVYIIRSGDFLVTQKIESKKKEKKVDLGAEAYPKKPG